jgi:copper chaperone NosL
MNAHSRLPPHGLRRSGGFTRCAVASMLMTSVLMVGCSEKVKTVEPEEITNGTICALDGMQLMDYPGPKGQIQYDQGSPDFYCDTVEMLSIYLRPEQQRRITAVFTQDMGQADWIQPKGHWIDAKAAFYVLGSSRKGSMGPTLGSFAREADAQAFATKYGGKVLRFEQVTLDMVSLNGGVLRDERM